MKKRGFTLIEIIGVVILLGVLALIAVPTVNIIIKNGKDKKKETRKRIREKYDIKKKNPAWLPGDGACHDRRLSAGLWDVQYLILP